ncbi:MAG: hypothetical protein OXP69_07160 [Spirochaetaceae bacterium]|nr:hypothetical protein [Spirochaetaceae bacterium]MDE0229432.1 hypothetical protein [Spirochaetaceae bacterium]MDE0445332.1 hypothetical protein [Spirochaetaceae bacterium]
MRTAVVFFEGKNRKRLLSLAQALARGIETQGHQVDLIDGARDINSKLTIYGYIAIGGESITTFTGKIPEVVTRYLKNAGMISGKRCYAFVCKSPISANRALQRIMKAMEGEGMFLKNSGILNSEVEAQEVGRRLHIS